MCRLCSFEECLKFSWKETCSLSEQFSANSAPNQGLLIIRSLNLYTKMWISGFFFTPNLCAHVLLVVQTVDNLPAMQGSQVWFLGWEDPLEEGMATHSSILAWRISPWVHKEVDTPEQLSQASLSTSTSCLLCLCPLHICNHLQSYLQ